MDYKQSVGNQRKVGGKFLKNGKNQWKVDIMDIPIGIGLYGLTPLGIPAVINVGYRLDPRHIIGMKMEVLEQSILTFPLASSKKSVEFDIKILYF